MLELGFKALLAYLLGSVIGSLLLGQLRGVDIRTQGSGNAGGTNALRTQGWAFALGVDRRRRRQGAAGGRLAAGSRAARASASILRVDRDWLAVACACAVVFGHVYPVWYEFRGGKGAATLLGAVAVLAPAALLPVLLVWLATVMLTGYVGLGTMLGTATLPVYFALAQPARPPWLVFGLRDGGVHRLHAPFEPAADARGQREPGPAPVAAAAAMSGSAERLLHLLADGALHSGERLARELGVTRAAVWKLVAELRERGIAVASHERRGYQLEQPVELLEAECAAGRGRRPACPHPPRSFSSSAPPTTTCMPPRRRNRPRRASSSPSCRPQVAVDAAATGSRRSAPGSRSRSAGRSPRCGPTCRRSVSRSACAWSARCADSTRRSVQLKWPNDIVHRHAKLGGLLLQMRAEAGGPAYVVAGLGLNLRPAGGGARRPARPQATPVTDLADCCSRPLRPRSDDRRVRRRPHAGRAGDVRAGGIRHLSRATGRRSTRCATRR